ncbi:MAG: hypothetical protein RL685_7468, partial [Pseudomonadota bacterium]
MSPGLGRIRSEGESGAVRAGAQGEAQPGSSLDVRRHLILSMPHMAMGALSEFFFLKECGDIHWEMVSRGFGRSPQNLCDQSGNRLYMTFVRVRWQATHPLTSFVEGDALTFEGTLRRAGARLFVSKTRLTSKDGRRIDATLLSSFAYRNASGDLVKGLPELDSSVQQDDEAAAFVAGYFQLKTALSGQGSRGTHSLAGIEIEHAAEAIDRSDYCINPYHDINGANLLYFAAYPQVQDHGERRMMARLL